MDRRAFVRFGGTALASAALLPPMAAALGRSGAHGRDASLRHLVGSTLDAHADGQHLRVRVVGVDEGPRQPGLDQYTLRLEAVDGRARPEGLYQLQRVDGTRAAPYRGALYLQPGRDAGYFSAAMSQFAR